MKSFFFIPASNKRFLAKAKNIPADEFILDLEDAIHSSNLASAVANIIDLNVSNKYFVRIANYNPVPNYDFLIPIIENGFNRFVIPKLNHASELLNFISFYNGVKSKNESPIIIPLIENAKALFNLPEIINMSEVKCVGFGSHDYCMDIGMEHTFENISWARMTILNTGKAFGKNIIDIASMNLTDKEGFTEECKDAMAKGFDGKFIIHPWQLQIFQNIEFFTKEEIDLAKKVKNYLDKEGGIANFSIVKIDGNVIERPHLSRINKILITFGYDSIYNG